MRKLNLPWLTGVVLLPIVLLGLTYLLHEFQVKRNASSFIRQAKRAQSEKKEASALAHLRRYTKLAPDDAEGLILYGYQLADVNQYQAAYLKLEAALLKLPEGEVVKRKEVQRRILDIAIKMGRFKDAQELLQTNLLKDSPNDSKLLEYLATCQIKVNQDFEGAEKSLAAAIEYAPDHIDDYIKLAGVIAQQPERKSEANDLMDKMIELNSDNPQAYLLRANWRMLNLVQLTVVTPTNVSDRQKKTNELKEQLQADLEQVLKFVAKDSDRSLNLDADESAKLARTDADQLLTGAMISRTSGQISLMREFIERGINRLPSESRFYEQLADLEFSKENPTAGIASLRRGIAALPKNLDLKWRLAEQLNEPKDEEEVKKLIEELRNSKFPQAYVSYLEGKTLVRRNEWAPAIVHLEALRPNLRETPRLAKQVDLWLGIACRETNSPEQSLYYFRNASRLDPEWVLGRMMLADALFSSGLFEDAVVEYRLLCLGETAPQQVLIGLAKSLIESNKRRPLNQRLWSEFDTALLRLSQVESQGPLIDVLKSERMLVDGNGPGAEKALKAAREKNPKEMRLWGADIELALLNREWDRASSLIQEAEKLFGDTIAVRRWKGRMIAQRYAPEEAIPLIRELADPPADWNDANRIDLAYDMALLAYSVGDYGQAEKLAMIAKEAAPKNMAVLLLLLDIGSRAKKPELLERILKDIGDQTNEGAIWHYGEARRLVLLGNDSKDKNYYVEAKSHLVKASETRPTWERIYTLQAEINEREGDSNAAIEQYIESIKKGERSTSVSYRALALLISARRLDDAEKFINLLVESKCPFSPEMKRLEIELMIQLGKKDLALKLIESFAKETKGSRDPIWLGRVYLLLDKFDLAERQFRMAVEANPKAGNPRLLLVQTLVRAKQPEKAAVEVGEAQMAIEGDLAKVAIGQCYEIIGNTELAREHYEEALKQAPNNPDMRRTWVEFLMKTTAFAQAETELKQVLLQKFGSSKPEQEYRRWAQQRLVDALRSQQKTEKLDEAIIVLNDQIKQSGRESLDDKRRMAQILALYPSREKRQLAIEILEKLVEKEKVVALEAEERWMLAGLYQKAGESEKSRTELRNLIATRKDDIRALVGYIQLSLIANEPAEADLYLSSLKKLAPKDPTTLDLEIQILSARKNYAGITNLLKTIEAIPYENQDPETALRRQTWIARSFASTANKLAQSNDIRASKEFNAEADRFFSKLNMEKPDFTLMYAEYLSVTPEIDRALDLVQEHLTDISFARLERVTRNVMKNRLANPEQLARLQDFLQTREGKTEENIPLSLLTSDLLSWRGDLKASSERFKELLQRNENNVIVLNNYAVILALSSTENKEALRLINQAIKIGGPIDAFYDTRGMIYLAGLRPDLAVQDFERAATESDSAERRFHAAVAYSRMAASGGAGEERSLQAAKKSLARADELGLIEHDLHPLERVTLAKLRKDLDMPEPSK